MDGLVTIVDLSVTGVALGRIGPWKRLGSQTRGGGSRASCAEGQPDAQFQPTVVATVRPCGPVELWEEGPVSLLSTVSGTPLTAPPSAAAPGSITVSVTRAL